MSASAPTPNASPPHAHHPRPPRKNQKARRDAKFRYIADDGTVINPSLMFDTICSLPLSADLFAQALHPTAPLLAVGLGSGHVATLRLPALDDDAPVTRQPGGRLKQRQRRGSNGTGIIDTAWRTKRHKGSCRCLAYSLDGVTLYSAGTDGLVKAADSTSGWVTGKLALPPAHGALDAPTTIHALSPQTLLVGTDSGALHLYDLRDPAPSYPVDAAKTAFPRARPSATFHPHTDYISSLTPIPPSATSTSGYSKQFLTTGSTTLALTDLRRGVLAQSESQEELLLSSLYITGLPIKKASNGGASSSGERALVGGGDGVLTLWEKGQWDDQDERIIVSREKETLDCLVEFPDGIGSMEGGIGRKVAVGQSDGKVRFVNLGRKAVVGEISHDESQLEGVLGLGFDVGGRMISGGGRIIKVWREAGEGVAEREDEEDEGTAVGKRAAESENDDDDEAESSEEEDQPAKRRKKRKRGKGPSSNGNGLTFAGLD